MVTYELRFDDYAIEHKLYNVDFRNEDKDGVEVKLYDIDESCDVVAVKYTNSYFVGSEEIEIESVIRIADGLRWTGGNADEYKKIRQHTQLWEVHEQYKRRIW